MSVSMFNVPNCLTDFDEIYIKHWRENLLLSRMSKISSTLHETRIEHHRISKKWLIMKKNVRDFKCRSYSNMHLVFGAIIDKATIYQIKENSIFDHVV
jgi:hypothetical protein